VPTDSCCRRVATPSELLLANASYYDQLASLWGGFVVAEPGTREPYIPGEAGRQLCPSASSARANVLPFPMLVAEVRAVWGVSFLPGIMEPVYDYDEPGTLDQPTPSFLAAVEDWQFLHPSAMPPPVPTIRGGARCKD
jgi:hypothetical protein